MSVKIIVKFISSHRIWDIDIDSKKHWTFRTRVKPVSHFVLPPNKMLYDFVTCMGNVHRTMPSTSVLCFPVVLCHNLSIYCSVTMTFCSSILCSRTDKLKIKIKTYALFSNNSYHNMYKNEKNIKSEFPKANKVNQNLSFLFNYWRRWVYSYSVLNIYPSFEHFGNLIKFGIWV